MSAQTWTTFFAVLALACNAATVGIVGTRALSAGSGGWRRRWGAIKAALAGPGVDAAWIIAVVATAGSLYYSEVAGFEPCLLCWYQRIAMYPLVVILGTAALRNDRAGGRRFALPLAAIGGVLSAYHYLLQRFPDLETSATCGVGIPCSAVWVERFGFITIPYMALSAFVMIVVFLAVARPAKVR